MEGRAETGESETRKIRELYKNLLTHHNTGIVPDFFQMDVETPSNLEGEHFLSSVDFITLHVNNSKKEEDEKKGEALNRNPNSNQSQSPGKIHLFAKRVVEEFREVQATPLLAFEKESGFFKGILSEFNEIVHEKAGPQFEINMVPKCYAANEDAIILENLTKRGYDMVNKEEKLNLTQTTLVIKNLAKFHALGYVLLSEKSPAEVLEKYPFLEERIYAPNSKFGFIASYMEPNLGIMLKLLKEFPSPGSDYAVETVNSLVGKLEETLPPFYKVNPVKGRNVIGHGDMWSNNFMFHQNPKTGEEDDIIFVDYQVIRISLPSLDLCAFLFAAVDHQLRAKNMNQFLKLYYDELDENVRKLKGNLSFSFEDFVEEFRANCLPGFISGVAITISLAGLKVLKTMEKIPDEGMLDRFQRAVKLWAEQNPEEVKNLAQTIAQFFQEYKTLTT